MVDDSDLHESTEESHKPVVGVSAGDDGEVESEHVERQRTNPDPLTFEGKPCVGFADSILHRV